MRSYQVSTNLSVFSRSPVGSTADAVLDEHLRPNASLARLRTTEVRLHLVKARVVDQVGRVGPHPLLVGYWPQPGGTLLRHEHLVPPPPAQRCRRAVRRFTPCRRLLHHHLAVVFGQQSSATGPSPALQVVPRARGRTSMAHPCTPARAPEKGMHA